jgi:hypothetical protein
MEDQLRQELNECQLRQALNECQDKLEKVTVSPIYCAEKGFLTDAVKFYKNSLDLIDVHKHEINDLEEMHRQNLQVSAPLAEKEAILELTLMHQEKVKLLQEKEGKKLLERWRANNFFPKAIKATRMPPKQFIDLAKQRRISAEQMKNLQLTQREEVKNLKNALRETIDRQYEQKKRTLLEKQEVDRLYLIRRITYSNKLLEKVIMGRKNANDRFDCRSRIEISLE